MKYIERHIHSRRRACDVEGRLVSKYYTAVKNRLDSATTTWAYDANGNRTQENGATIASYDSQDRLQTWRNNSYQYNAAGDLASKTTPSGTTNYTYDARGNLRKVVLENGKSITYAIDPASRRTGKTVDGQLQWQLVWLDGSATLARDAGLLVHQAGYRCTAAGVVNMFPHTAHVESVAVFDLP